MGFAQEPPKDLPRVISAEVPFYPQPARVANIQGEVRIWCRTNGQQVVETRVESGPPMLAKAGLANIQTWRFEQHASVAFTVTFKYQLATLPPCEPNERKHDEVSLQLPIRVEVKGTRQGECDPVPK